MSKKQEKQTFEQALEKLEKIVEGMEEGKMDLDRMLAQFEDGMELAKFCGKKLDSAEKKVDILVKKHDGGKELERFEGPGSNEDEDDEQV